jgi:hypothetical protein
MEIKPIAILLLVKTQAKSYTVSSWCKHSARPYVMSFIDNPKTDKARIYLPPDHRWLLASSGSCLPRCLPQGRRARSRSGRSSGELPNRYTGHAHSGPEQ